ISVVGTILSPGGEPVPGATVVLRAELGTEPYEVKVDRDILARTKTNSDGRFILRRIGVPLRMFAVIEKLSIHEGGAEIVAWSDDFGFACTEIHGLDGNPDVRLQLVPKADVRGTVTDTNGKPIPGAAIRILGATKSDSFYDTTLRERGYLN